MGRSRNVEVMETAGFAFLGDEGIEPILTGEERWPVIGNLLSKDQVEIICKRMKGLKVYWDCIKKAEIALDVLGKSGRVVVGSMFVMSGDCASEYGYSFNPPFEIHAWVMTVTGIIDVALPGVIQKGMVTRDSVGPFIVGRDPVILAGVAPNWIRYLPMEIIKGGGK